MSKFVETLRLKELAEEDIYFARRDQERIQALPPRPGKKRKLARAFEKQYRKVNRACRKEPLMLIRAIRRLVDKILVAFHLAEKPSE